MQRFRNIPMTLKVIGLITTCVIFFATCINNEEQKEIPVKQAGKTMMLNPPRYEVYAGSEKCASCHRDIYENHALTSHFLTTVDATGKTIKGSFKKGSNMFAYNPDLNVKMERRDSGFFQVVYYQGQEKIAIPFDIIVGSGTKGQSFIYWRDNRLFQMPVSYFSVTGEWMNSPGFPGKVQIDRPITARCLECHATYADVISPRETEPEEFSHEKMILGIGCEKCHGPGKEHITFHTAKSNEKEGKHIINPADLTRERQLDLCALCHGGRKQKVQPPFTFTAGDTLENFYLPATNSSPIPDVHGNQLGLLAASKCFTVSATMTCNTCHDPHKNERGKLEAFSRKCMSCHTSPHKELPGKNMTLAKMKLNCIDCHMPTQSSFAIRMMGADGEQKAAKFRSHFISIYPDRANSKSPGN